MIAIKKDNSKDFNQRDYDDFLNMFYKKPYYYGDFWNGLENTRLLC